MPKLQIYDDGSDNAVVVVKDANDDDAWNIPPSDVHRLNFDSRNSMVPRVLAIRRRDRNEFQSDQSGGPRYYSLDGLSVTTHASLASLTSFFVGFGELIGNTLGLDYPPVVISKRYNSDGVWLRNNVQYLASRGDGSTTLASNAFVWPSFSNGISSGRVNLFYSPHTNFGTNSNLNNPLIDNYDGWLVGGVSHFSRSNIGTRDRTSYHQVILNLPADNRPIPNASGPGGPDRTVVRITPDTVKIARDGFDVDAAVGDELLIDSNSSPIKIVASGLVTVAGNTTVEIDLPSGIDYGDDLFIEAIVNVAGEPVRHPLFRGNRSLNNVGVETRVLDNKLLMRTINGTAVEARYICYGSDNRPPTSGTGTSSIRAPVIDGEQVYQIVTPSANDEVLNLSDVLIDTRFPYVPIIKEGYIPVTQGTTAYQVDFENTGFTPYVWFMCELAGNNGPVFIGGLAEIRDNNTFGPITCIAQLNDNFITFFAAFTNNAANERRLVGIRYYILALPS